MVAEPLTETAPATDLQPESSGEPPASPAVDPIESEVTDFLQGPATNAEAPSAESSPPEDEFPEITEAKEAAAKAAAEKAERETKARIAQEEAERQDKAKKAAADKEFRDEYANDVRKAMESARQRALRLGATAEMAEEAAQEAKSFLNKRHEDGMRLYETDAFAKANGTFSQLINDAIREDLGADAEKFFGTEAEPKGYDGMKAALKGYREVVTDGLISKAEAEADTKLALVKYRRHLEEQGLINGARSGQPTNGAPASGRRFANEDALNTAWNNREITRTEFAQEKKRLTGRDLDD